MRVTLATPSFVSNIPNEPLSMPMGIAYLAAVLENNGCEVSVIDGSLIGSVTRLGTNTYLTGATPEELAKQISETRPDIVGLSCPFTTRYRLFRETMNELRMLRPELPVIAGGIHTNLFQERVLRESKPDLIILGEGEDSLLELIRRFDEQGKLNPDSIDGTAWLHNDKLQVNPKSQFIFDLDKLPFPARHLFPVEKYLKRSGGRWAAYHQRIMSILTSRSCPGRCSFCGIHAVMGKKWRAHSAGRVLDELEQVVENWNPSLIGFEDDRLTWNRERMMAICQGMIDRKISVRWYTPNGVHVNDLDEDLLRLMKKSGCQSLNLAIESGDPEILHRVIGKKATSQQARDVAAVCRKLKIRTNGYFIIGMPGETDKSIQNSLDLCLDLKLDGLGLFIATPFPGTRMFDTCVKKGYLDPDEFVEKYLEANDPDTLHLPLFETETMTKERLMKWEKRFQSTFLNDLYRRRPQVRVKASVRRMLGGIGG